MRVNFDLERDKEKEFLLGMMERNMKEVSRMIKDMVTASIFMRIRIFTKEDLPMV